jgi:hypothetical protein
LTGQGEQAEKPRLHHGLERNPDLLVAVIAFAAAISIVLAIALRLMTVA